VSDIRPDYAGPFAECAWPAAFLETKSARAGKSGDAAQRPGAGVVQHRQMIAFLRHLVLHDLLLKLFSLALAILIWLTINFAIGRNEDRPPGSVPPFVPHPAPQPATF